MAWGGFTTPVNGILSKDIKNKKVKSINYINKTREDSQRGLNFIGIWLYVIPYNHKVDKECEPELQKRLTLIYT